MPIILCHAQSAARRVDRPAAKKSLDLRIQVTVEQNRELDYQRFVLNLDSSNQHMPSKRIGIGAIPAERDCRAISLGVESETADVGSHETYELFTRFEVKPKLVRSGA
jgi:hypothetical protein